MTKLKSFFQKFSAKISIDYSFLLLLILAIFLDSFRIYFLYVIFIILHELSHFFVAKKLGYLPKKVKLSVFGATLEGFDDFLTLDEIKIVLAGPLFNLFIIIGCYLSFWFYPETYSFLMDVLFVNQMILLFNILPVFPLDMGRVLLCIFSLKKGRRNSLKFIKKFSLFFVVCMFILSVIFIKKDFAFSLGFASINLCILLFETSYGTSFKREISFKKKLSKLNKGINQKIIYIKNGYPEKLLLKFIDGENYYVFIFVDEECKEIGRIDELTLMKNLGFI